MHSMHKVIHSYIQYVHMVHFVYSMKSVEVSAGWLSRICLYHVYIPQRHRHDIGIVIITFA